MHLGKLERRSEAAVARRRLGERHLRDLQRREDAGQALQLLPADSGPGTTGIVQATVLRVVAKEQGANVIGFPSNQSAHDYKLLAV